MSIHPIPPKGDSRATQRGFSLIELLTAMGILSILMLLLTIMLDSVQRSWTYSESRISQFREARVAFDLMSKNLSQASVNTYWDLIDHDNDGIIDGFFKTSELHFEVMRAERLRAAARTQDPVAHAVFFQAPLGFSSRFRNLDNLYNGRGYFVAYGSDAKFRPSWLQGDPTYRFRLMEFRPPAESNQVFADGGEQRDANPPERQEFTNWFLQSMSGVGEGTFEDHLNPLASNIIALFISPRDSISGRSSERRDETHSDIAPNYLFDSNDEDEEFESFAQQVPPLVRVTMVAIDETSAERMSFESPSTTPQLIPGGLFTNTEDYQKDIDTLVESLLDQGINHKVFSSVVMLRSAKWSGEN